MADPIPPPTKRKIKIAYMTGGLSLSAAAAKYGVSERMAHEWSRKEGWAKAKAERNGQQPQAPAVKLTTFPSSRGQQAADPADAPPLELPKSLDDLRLTLDRAIAKLDAAIASPHDGKNLAQQAASLGKLVEARARIGDDTWLLNEMLARFPSPKLLIQRLREMYRPSPPDGAPQPNLSQADSWTDLTPTPPAKWINPN